MLQIWTVGLILLRVPLIFISSRPDEKQKYYVQYVCSRQPPLTQPKIISMQYNRIEQCYTAYIVPCCEQH